MTAKTDPFDFTDLEDWESEYRKADAPDEFTERDEWVAGNFGNANSANRDAVYVEKCKDCRGTGSFVSWSGRRVGPCFKCDGTGKRTFKTSPEQRAKARETAAKRKEKAQAELAARAADWIDAHKDVYAFLMDNRSWSEFYGSMVDNIAKFGGLTDKQLEVVESALAKARQKAQDRAKLPGDATISPEGLRRLHEAFSAAREHLKYPKLHIAGLIISRAPDTGKNAGCLYIKSETECNEYGERLYLGKITETGEFFKVKACGSEYVETLKSIADDPLKAAQLHGLKTGRCSCCNRELTNQESVELGIGPICRDKWGF